MARKLNKTRRIVRLRTVSTCRTALATARGTAERGFGDCDSPECALPEFVFVGVLLEGCVVVCELITFDLAGALDAMGRIGNDIEPRLGNFGFAFDAGTIDAVFDPLKSSFYLA